MKFSEKLFQTKLLSRLSHKVCRLRSSPFFVSLVHVWTTEPYPNILTIMNNSSMPSTVHQAQTS